MKDKKIRAAILKLKPVSIDRIAFAESELMKIIEVYPFWFSNSYMSDKQTIKELDEFEAAFLSFQNALTRLSQGGIWAHVFLDLPSSNGSPSTPLNWVNESQRFAPLLQATRSARDRVAANPKVKRSRPINRNARTLASFLGMIYERVTDKRPPLGLEHNRKSAFGQFIADIFKCVGEAGDPAYYANYAAELRKPYE